MGSIQRASFAIVIIGCTIAVINMYITVLRYQHDVTKDLQYEKEDISIIYSSVSYKDEIDYTRHNLSEGVLNGVQYIVTICNNSKQRVSIVEADCYNFKDGTFVQYNNILQGILDINGKSVSLPISLDVNEALKLILDINTLITMGEDGKVIESYEIAINIEHYIVSEVLEDSNHLEDNQTIKVKYRDLKEYLVDRELEIFDNKLSVSGYGENRLISISEPTFPIYRVNFKTAKGNVFYKLLHIRVLHNKYIKWITRKENVFMNLQFEMQQYRTDLEILYKLLHYFKGLFQKFLTVPLCLLNIDNEKLDKKQFWILFSEKRKHANHGKILGKSSICPKNGIRKTNTKR